MQDDGSALRAPFYNFRAVIQAQQAAAQLNLQPPSARLVLLAVAQHTNGVPAFPSYQQLSHLTGLGTSQIRHLIDHLVATGYLEEERTPRKGGGWGKPVWLLGPTCQVSADAHLPQEQVSPRRHSSVSTQTLASVSTQTPKRDSVDPVDSVVPEKSPEEKAAPLPPAPMKAVPKPKTEKQELIGNPRVQAFFDGLRGPGGGKCALEGTLTGQDFKFIKEGDFDACDLAACYRSTADGTWAGADAWIKERLSVANVHKYRYARWVTQGTPTAAPASANGRPSRIQEQLARMERMRAREEPRSDVRRVQPSLPAARDAL